MNVVGRAGRSSSAACAMPGVTGAAPAFQRFAHQVARRWELPDTVCDTVALMAGELVHGLAGFGMGLDTSLMITVDDTTVTLRARETGRPRPPARGATAPDGRRPRCGDASAVPRRPVGGACLEARVLLPEPEPVETPKRFPVFHVSPIHADTDVPVPCRSERGGNERAWR